MKIGPQDNKLAPLTPAPERKGSSPAVKSALPAAVEPSAKVALSASASAASSTASAAHATSVVGDGSFDGAKVGRIAQAIRDGKFTVNADAIAEKLIRNAEELLGGRKPN